MPHSAQDVAVAPAACLNCGAPLDGAYCAACGQQAVDLAAPTWHVVREAVADAMDVDGRVFRTARALITPGRLTVEFLRGRRAPYVGPLKLFVLAGAALTTTWIVTRAADARYYGLPATGAADGAYIDTAVRGALAASLAVAVTSWLLGRARRRLLDEVVFALHLVTALSLLTTAAIWLGTVWKLAWGTVAGVPSAVPSLVYLLFLPAGVLGLVYATVAVRRVHGVAWWAAELRAVVLVAVGFAALLAVILTRRPT